MRLWELMVSVVRVGADGYCSSGGGVGRQTLDRHVMWFMCVFVFITGCVCVCAQKAWRRSQLQCDLWGMKVGVKGQIIYLCTR